MESYTRYYGRYAELEWREANQKWTCCPQCGKESLEFLVTDENDVIGCTECMVTAPSDDERYIVDVEDAAYLQCPCCGEICDTLYASKTTPYYVDGCEKCLEWIDSWRVDCDE